MNRRNAIETAVGATDVQIVADHHGAWARMVLGLESNYIGDGGAKALTALKRLTRLDRRDNHIGDEGAKALAALLKGPINLDLFDNDIGDQGTVALRALTGKTWC